MADEQTTPATGADDPNANASGEQEPQAPEPPQSGDGDLPESVKEILAKERKAAREAEKARKAAEARVKEFEDASKSEQEKLAEENSTLKGELTETQTALARFQVAAEKKLPGELVELLSGTKEEMAEKADVLLQHIADRQQAQVPDFGGGAQPNTAAPKPADQAHNDLILALTGHLPQQTQ